MKYFDINSEVKLSYGVPPATRELVKTEPMLFSCNKDEALAMGGLLTKAFLNNLPVAYCDDPTLIVDSRVHMLMKGWYPCIPGWHHDDVDRSRHDGQPNYWNPSYRTRHAICLLGDDIAPTEFALGQAPFPEVAEGRKVYGEWNTLVDCYLKSSTLKRYVAPMNTIIMFDDRAWHRGVAATGTGWRFFIRASVGRKKRQAGEVRRQVQVYLEALEAGW